MQRRTFISTSAVFAAGITCGAGAAIGTSTVIAWNQALTGAIAATRTQATIAARACSMVHEAIYNAWAAYDTKAAFTLSQMRKQSWGSDPTTWQSVALSHAAHVVLVNLFPTQKASFDALLTATTSNIVPTAFFAIARNIGLLAGNSLVQARAQDGSNQNGDLAPGAYSDWTGYVPLNNPDTVVDPTRWQPLRLVDATGATVVQKFLTPHWGLVRPFALTSGAQYRPQMAHRAPTLDEMNQLIALSAALDDTTKSQVEYWAANPGTVSPPSQWMKLAEQVSAQDRNTLAADVRLFFTVAQAVHDAGIAAWDSKRAYDSVRPITAIPYYFRGQTIKAWGGFNQGTQSILGENWRPYQRSTNPSPPFPEFVSGHSTFSASAATAIAGLRGSDATTLTGSVAAGGIGFEINTPSQTVNFTWSSFTQAADSAGLSRRLGGIHFEQGDLGGRVLGRQVGNRVLTRCKALFAGSTA